MKVLEEITVWDSKIAPNHIYFTDDSKSRMYAYVRQGTDQVFRFGKPIGISTKGRKFREIANRWNFVVKDGAEDVPKIMGKEYQVPGSKGAIYTVTNDSGTWTCTCPAAKWQRGECKHIVQLKTEA